MREKVDQAHNDLPGDLENDPVVTQINIDDVPVVTMALTADLPPIALYDMAKETIKPMLEQVRGVGEVRLIGGTRREIQVELDRNKLNEYQISASAVAESLRISGVNISVGKYDSGNKSTVFRTIGEFKRIDQINKSLVSFSGDNMSSSVTISKLGTVRDDAEDVKTHAYLYFAADDPEHGKGGSSTGLSALEKKGAKNDLRQCILIDVVKQSGSNSVSVAEDAIKRIETINETIKSPREPAACLCNDTSKYIRMNIERAETMIIGIILTILVVPVPRQYSVDDYYRYCDTQ